MGVSFSAFLIPHLWREDGPNCISTTGQDDRQEGPESMNYHEQQKQQVCIQIGMLNSTWSQQAQDDQFKDSTRDAKRSKMRNPLLVLANYKAIQSIPYREPLIKI